MLKKNKLKIIISSLIVLLPMLFGLIMWNRLPDIMTTHFGADGNADGFSGKAFAVFVLPCILLVLHFICLLFTLFDKKQKEQSKKALGMIFWIIPMISLSVNAIMYCIAFGKEINFSLLMPMFIGIPFILMGNYMPKIKQNKTLGIKVKWALNNEGNWNKTHRFGGKAMVCGGFVMLISVFLPAKAMISVTFATMIITVLAPIVYSYLVYKNDIKVGIVYTEPPKSKVGKIIAIISAVIVFLIIIGTVVLMFTGDIEVKLGENSFKINATYWTDIEVNYADIDTAEYRNELDVGVRTNGFGSARLSMGVFQNKEFGSYTLYAYTGAKEFVVLTSGEKTLVIGMKYAKATAEIYDVISKKI